MAFARYKSLKKVCIVDEKALRLVCLGHAQSIWQVPYFGVSCLIKIPISLYRLAFCWIDVLVSTVMEKKKWAVRLLTTM